VSEELELPWTIKEIVTEVIISVQFWVGLKANKALL
jgi:hypothetical protein